MFNHFKNKTAFIALAIGLTLAQPTLASTINFDSLAVGSNPNSNTLGITFDNAVFLPNLDSTGTPITGTDHWQIDNIAPALTVVNGAALNLVNFNSGLLSHYAINNSLDAIQQTVLMHLGGIYNVASFSLNASSFDRSSFSGFYNPTIDFLDINGNAIGSVAFSTPVGGIFTASLSTSLLGVTDVVLAGGALYNNISFNVTAVPVPGAIWLFGSALAGLVGLRRRKA